MINTNQIIIIENMARFEFLHNFTKHKQKQTFLTKSKNSANDPRFPILISLTFNYQIILNSEHSSHFSFNNYLCVLHRANFQTAQTKFKINQYAWRYTCNFIQHGLATAEEAIIMYSQM